MPGSRILTLAEFEGVYACDDPSPPVREGLHPLDRKRFAQLEELAIRLASLPESDASDSVLSLGSRKGVGKVVSTRNHVGVVALADGTQIEILPKTIRSFGAPGSKERKGNEENHRKLFLRMLREAWDLDAKEAMPAELGEARLPVYEAFIRMFLGCVSELVKRGLPGGYARIESNEPFFKGKLLMADHIRNNLVRKDRFFVAHDEFSLDNPANRILRTGLEWVVKTTHLDSNRRLARQLLAVFEDVPRPSNLVGDFDSCAAAERNAHCKKAIDWCRVFLRGLSISNLPGTRHAQALLFPMETIFERYVARLVRKLAPPEVCVTTQDRSLHLFDESSKGAAFQLKPDIVLRRAENGADRVVVADTKWKILCDDPTRNYGISTGDMYQMYAYAKRHKARSVLLVYPKHDSLGSIQVDPPFFRTPDDSDIRVCFFDLTNSVCSAHSTQSILTHIRPCLALSGMNI